MPGNLLKYFYEVSPIYPKANDSDEKIQAQAKKHFLTYLFSYNTCSCGMVSCLPLQLHPSWDVYQQGL